MPTRPNDPPNAGSQGFLLVETLVVLAIIGISLLGILSQSSNVVRGNRISDHKSAATKLAQAKIEEIQGQRFLDIANGSDPTSLTVDGAPGGIFNRIWLVIPTIVRGLPAKHVRVTVLWPESGNLPSVTMSTLVVDLPYHSPNFRTVIERSWRRG